MYNGVQIKEQETDEYKEGYLQGVIDSQVKKEIIKDVMEMKEEQTDFHKRLLDTYGSFYFNFYKRTNIEGQFLFRFIYLCSFMNYDGYLSDGRRLLRETNLRDLLMLGNTEYYKTKKYLLEKELIFIDDKELVSVNNKYCKKVKYIKLSLLR